MCLLCKKSKGLSASGIDPGFVIHWKDLKGCDDINAPRESPMNTIVEMGRRSSANQSAHRESSIQNLKGSVIKFRRRVLECGSKVVGTIDTLISGCNKLFLEWHCLQLRLRILNQCMWKIRILKLR
jgi:hypothetical protein